MPQPRRKPMQLARVADPTGRVDVAAYRAIEKLMERLEKERSLVGLRENLMPLIESAIVGCLPHRNVLRAITPELQALWSVLQQNRGRF